MCGDHEIVITIDSGIVEELKLDLNEEFVYFGNFDTTPENKNDNNNCHAELDNDKFKLKLQAPFSSCGTELLTVSIKLLNIKAYVFVKIISV